MQFVLILKLICIFPKIIIYVHKQFLKYKMFFI